MRLRHYLEEGTERKEVIPVIDACAIINRSTPMLYHYIAKYNIETVRFDRLYIIKSSFISACRNNAIKMNTELL